MYVRTHIRSPDSAVKNEANHGQRCTHEARNEAPSLVFMLAIPLCSWRVKPKADWETEQDRHRACQS
jgi:hypothetical protein